MIRFDKIEESNVDAEEIKVDIIEEPKINYISDEESLEGGRHHLSIFSEGTVIQDSRF